MKDSIRLSIPSKPEYISVVRLTASSIASNMGMTIDDIEDIKVSISEACMNAMIDKEKIDIEFTIYEDRLTISIDNAVENKTSEEYQRVLDIGISLIKSLMNEVVFTDKGVEMTKNIEDGLL